MLFHPSLLLSLAIGDSHQQTIIDFLTQEKILTTASTQNPDLHFINQEGSPLQIDDVRRLTQEMVMQPYQSAQSTFVIFQIDQASLPAQNALLKSLEEPPAHVQLILTTDRIEKVLPTIQSRCVIKKLIDQSIKKSDEGNDVEQLLCDLHASYATAFTTSEKYKDRGTASHLLHQLLIFFHQANQQHPQYNSVRTIQAILVTQDLIEKNVNVRLALEELFFQLKTLASSQFNEKPL